MRVRASITQGFWDTEGGWVARLRKHYDTKAVENIKHNDEPTIFNLGISGNTVQGLLARFKSETETRLDSSGMAFVFSIGTNNAATGMEHAYNPDDYAVCYSKVIEHAKQYSDKILIVGLPSCNESMTTPVSWRNIDYTNERIKAIEDKSKGVAEKNGIAFLPIFDEFKKYFDAGEKIFADGLHPNDAGHELIFNLVKPELDRMIFG